MLCVCRGEGNFENTHNEVIFEDDNILKDCVKGAFSLPVVLSFVPNSIHSTIILIYFGIRSV